MGKQKDFECVCSLLFCVGACVCVLNDTSVLLGRLYENLNFVDLVHPEGLSFTCRRGTEKIIHGNIWSSAVFLQVYHTAMVLLLLCDNATKRDFFWKTCIYLSKNAENQKISFFLNKKICLYYLLMHSLNYDLFIFEASAERDLSWPTITEMLDGLEF